MHSREEALRRSEERFRAFMDNSPTVAWAKDEAGRYVYLSRTFEKRFGVRLEDWRGKTTMELWPRDTADEFRRSDMEALSLGHAVELIEEVPIPERGLATWWSFKFPFQDASGKRYVGGIGVDVTGQRKAEEELRESEERYRTLFENAPLGLFRSTPEGKFIEVNQALAEMLGYDSPGSVLREIHSIADQLYVCSEARQPIVDKQLKSQSVTRHLNRYRRRDGEEFIANLYLKTIRSSDGRPLYLEGIVEDITDRKRAEEALRESEDRYRDLVENSQDLICTHDLSGAILSINPRPAQLLGYNPKELLGMNVRDILVPEVRHKFGNYLDEIKSNRTARGLMYVQTKKGEQRIWEYNNTLRTEGVREAIVRGMAHDVTEQKRAQEALKRSRDELDLRVQERTSELTEANAALKESERQLKILSSRLISAQEDERRRVACEIHDSVGQSLHAIKSGMKNLSQQVQQTIFAPRLEEEFDHLLQVVDFSIEEVRSVYMGLRPLLLDDLGILATVNWFIRECRKAYPYITIDGEIQIQEEEVPEPLKIVIFRLLQAAMDNVARHSKAERACVSLERIDGKLELRVGDNGVGFSLGDITQEKKPGEALGIAIMQERVESSGGVFTIKSSKGQGTTIRAFGDLSRFA